MTLQDKSFKELFDHSLDSLDLFTVAITRAHGESHPEAFEVRELFEVIQEKVTRGENHRVDLHEEFTQLRSVTNQYDVPNDVCETYANVYEMLRALDDAYHAS